MNKIIRPSPFAYLPFGIVAGLLLAAFSLTVASRSFSGYSLMAATLPLLGYGLWYWYLRGHSLTITDKGLTLRNRWGRHAHVDWSSIERLEIPYASARPLLQLVVWCQNHHKPAMRIPLRLYRWADVRYLVSLENHFPNQSQSIPADSGVGGSADSPGLAEPWMMLSQ